jgi:signal peptidase II
MTMPRRFSLVFFLLALTIGVDQATKRMAIRFLKDGPAYTYLGDIFRLTYAENSGAFLSLGSQLPDNARFWVLTGGVGVLLLGLLVFSLIGKKLDGWQVAGYSVIAAGGISNWIDRATREGYVVDFMNMGIGKWVRTGVFNVADVAILVGIGLLLIFNKEPEKTPADAKSM